MKRLRLFIFTLAVALLSFAVGQIVFTVYDFFILLTFSKIIKGTKGKLTSPHEAENTTPTDTRALIARFCS